MLNYIESRFPTCQPPREFLAAADFIAKRSLSHPPYYRATGRLYSAGALLVLLYTGLRRSELKTLKIIDGTWLECETSKERMGKNIVKRQIPFTPMMKRVLPYIDFEKARNVNLNSLNTAIKRIFPNHHLHELRYTFITRCKESGVHGEVVLLWDGHEEYKTIRSSKVDRGYTNLRLNTLFVLTLRTESGVDNSFIHSFPSVKKFIFSANNQSGNVGTVKEQVENIAV